MLKAVGQGSGLDKLGSGNDMFYAVVTYIDSKLQKQNILREVMRDIGS